MLRASEAGVAGRGHERLHALSLEVRPGEVHAVLGANGAGKSTLLQLLAGDLAPARGTVTLDDRPLPRWPPADLARRRAVLPQHENLRFGFTVREVVQLGRLPWTGERPHAAARIVDAALERAGIAALAARAYPELSGGERARVQFARVLAQAWNDDDAPGAAARYLLLDEPTANLDLAYQYDCLNALRRFADRGGGVLAILHDPNQALACADRVSLLGEGRLLASGRAADTLTADRLGTLYGVEVSVARVAGRDRPYFVVG